ncbi:Uncharacterised protein [BD1-7 clade bacterium]|uniref:Pyridoxamine 5'-phosphate oxidase putative domain-containing protein n=1 Tax=BD1-7 clade bacterium TaxID=2029982 RepID=A0A5S9MYQ5_9GAMM|nr:Uncharacterised protein [BD1-7 clade bacterium]CAA0082552.1 Uncharacterised protein [BD1-7 clade bacterium]
MTPLPLKTSSRWNQQQVEDYLSGSQVPIRVACMTTNETANVPLVASHWFTYNAGLLYCVIHKQSVFCKHLNANPSVGFEIAGDVMPYKGIRGQGVAHFDPKNTEKLLKAALQKYRVEPQTKLASFLLGRLPEEVAIAITPRWLTSWDFSDRMSDIT